MKTSAVAPEIVTFAEAVRAALADLPAEEVDDLTEGLEADLAESLAEDLRRTLPDPVAYAAELRLAAGLPSRPARTDRRPSEVWTDVRRRLAEVIQRNPGLEAVVDFLAALRPAWWIVRAWLAAWLLAAFFGAERYYGVEGSWWLVMLGFVVISIQWGRGGWSFRGLRKVVAVGNVIAVVALLPALAAAQSWGGDDRGGSYETGFDAGAESGFGEDGDGAGLFFNGTPLENVYVYDSAGNKLSGVQLFDVDGKPLVPYRNSQETQVQQTPATLETGAEAYNVYPLQITRLTWDDDMGELVPDPNPDPDKAAAYANGPFIKVPAVLAPAAVTPQEVAEPNE